MTVVLELKPEIEKALIERARLSDSPVDSLAERLLEREVKRMQDLDEVLAPIRKNFEDSGMNEDELDALIDSEREAMWNERQTGKKL